MLDPLHHQTEPVFLAAGLEDEIRAHLLALDQEHLDVVNPGLRYSDIVSRIIPELRRLNDEHFGSSQAINQHLDKIAGAAERQHLEYCWKHFLALVNPPGENFGTWAI